MADRLIEPFGVLQLMLLGAGVLGAPAAAHQLHRPHRARPPAARRQEGRRRRPQPRNAFAMVFRTRYLLLMGLMLMMLNWINTTGEYILGSIVKDTATAMIAAGEAPGLTEGQIIGDFYAKYFTLVNVLGLILQMFVVSRIVKHFGCRLGGDGPSGAVVRRLQHPGVHADAHARCWRPRSPRTRRTTR